jgi:molybdate transport system substrate-binding protein
MTRRTTIVIGLALASGLAGLAAAQVQVAKPAPKKELAVFAAASLREVFEGLVPAFETANPGVKVRLNLAGSQELRTQLEQGARADVLAAADLENMGTAEKQGLVERPVVFARNQPVIVVPRDNPAGIAALTDLPKTRRLVVGAPEVPIGRYTVKILEAAARKHGADLRAKIEAGIVSRELNVRQVLAKVTLGEADAGIVYRTDARAAGDRVRVVPIPADLEVIAEYPIAVVKAAPQPSLARAWVALVLSRQGQDRLIAAGFTGGGTPVSATAAKAPAPAPAPAR